MMRAPMTELELESARRREVLEATRRTATSRVDERRGRTLASSGSAVRRSLTDLTRALFGLPAQRA